MLALANIVASRNPVTLGPFLTSRPQEEGPTIKGATSRGMVFFKLGDAACALQAAADQI